MSEFLSGAIMMGCLVSGLFFLRFWKETRDRFFAIFAASFWVLALERFVLQMVDNGDDFKGYVYLMRLVAFALILAAIAEKNRKKTAL